MSAFLFHCTKPEFHHHQEPADDCNRFQDYFQQDCDCVNVIQVVCQTVVSPESHIK